MVSISVFYISTLGMLPVARLCVKRRMAMKEIEVVSLCATTCETIMSHCLNLINELTTRTTRSNMSSPAVLESLPCYSNHCNSAIVCLAMFHWSADLIQTSYQQLPSPSATSIGLSALNPSDWLATNCSTSGSRSLAGLTISHYYLRQSSRDLDPG